MWHGRGLNTWPPLRKERIGCDATWFSNHRANQKKYLVSRLSLSTAGRSVHRSYITEVLAPNNNEAPRACVEIPWQLSDGDQRKWLLVNLPVVVPTARTCAGELCGRQKLFVIQSISSWLSKNCDENSRMRKISYSKSRPKCAHARILVAIFGQPTGNRLYQWPSCQGINTHARGASLLFGARTLQTSVPPRAQCNCAQTIRVAIFLRSNHHFTRSNVKYGADVDPVRSFLQLGLLVSSSYLNVQK